MIIDFITFFNELDLLELRLKTLEKKVDKFVIVESPVTYKGDPKRLLFKDQFSRFAQWHSKIWHIVIYDMPMLKSESNHPNDPCWNREHHLRNAGMKYVEAIAKSDDVIIYSDCDEIPSPDSIDRFCNDHMGDGIMALDMQMYFYFLNIKKRERWPNAHIMTGDWARGKNRTQIWGFDGIANNKIISGGGWHFTYMGGITSIVSKARSSGEWANPSTEPMMRDVVGGRILERDAGMWDKVKIDRGFPVDVYENVDRWAEKGFIHRPLL